MTTRRLLITLIPLAIGLTSCGESEQLQEGHVWECAAAEASPNLLRTVGCIDDFEALASAPLDASIPGARSAKIVIDRADDNALYFINSNLYPVHYDFVSAELSGEALPIVPLLTEFNTTEYSSPTRRFLLGTVTWYEGPQVYVYEIAPYDSASSEMILEAFEIVEEATFFGQEMRFHANSASVAATAEPIADRVRLMTTTELFEGIDYQPLNVAESYGRMRFISAEDLGDTFLSFREIAVLDAVPNDITVVAGIVTEQFQTPLSHINVLSRNRGTPNMGLRGAFSDPALRALDGQWVRMEVGATEYTIEVVTREVADAWWEENKPSEVLIPGLDDSVAGLVDIEDTLDLENLELYDAIKAATRAFGGKAAHYGALSYVEGLPVPKAFAVPVSHYLKFMEDNGFNERVEQMLSDPAFEDDPALREASLEALREDMKATPVDPDLLTAITEKLNDEYPGLRMRFRSSTNAEDLDGFTGAGLYTSKSGDPNDPESPVEDAVRKVWSSVWNHRAFEERSFRTIDHLSVAMALLVHRSFPDEEANGVALTNNPFDPSGLEPAFYINVQLGETSVVLPPEGVTTESILYYFYRNDQPATLLSASSLVPEGQRVLSGAELFALGQGLDKIRTFFAPAYAKGQAWWAMDVEFKFDAEPGETPELFIKQARPYL